MAPTSYILHMHITIYNRLNICFLILLKNNNNNNYSYNTLYGEYKHVNYRFNFEYDN
jgi:hypothetical protein